jgi:hypothetical protein
MVARSNRAGVLALIADSRSPAPDRYAEVAHVLGRVLLLNLGVAVAKIAFGYASGAISILSDGFHDIRRLWMRSSTSSRRRGMRPIR